MRYIKEFLIAILLVAVILEVLDGQIQRKKVSEFDAKEKQLKASLDSLKALQHQADLYAMEWHTKYNVLEAGTKRQGDQLINVIKENAYLRKTYAPLLSDSVIQREVATLYKDR